jgi:Protein of unknown function (DUF2934)
MKRSFIVSISWENRPIVRTPRLSAIPGVALHARRRPTLNVHVRVSFRPKEPLLHCAVQQCEALRGAANGDVAMSEVMALQFETIRAIAATLIGLAVVLLCLVATSKSQVRPGAGPRQETIQMRNREIRLKEIAYLIWEEEGRPSGQADRHWRMAESAIQQEEGEQTQRKIVEGEPPGETPAESDLPFLDALSRAER